MSIKLDTLRKDFALKPRLALNMHDPGHTSWADGAHCRQAIRTGSRSFHLASQLLPQSMRWSAHAMYAFCREADDAIDEAEDPELAIAGMYERLNLIYAGTPADFAADRAFADIVGRFAIPRCVPDALLEGFCWDTMGRKYETLSDVVSYAVRVASTVGVMMTLVMGRRERNVLARAADLGIAMQLTNIARDVGEDARNGRLYLPRQMLLEAGLDPDAWLAEPRFCPEVASVTRQLLAVADEFYARGEAGIENLPRRCRSAIRAAGVIYAEIGREIERNGLDSVTRRAVTSRKRKLALLGQIIIKPARARYSFNRATGALPEADEASFLLDAVDNQLAPRHNQASLKPLWHYSGWGDDLFGLLTRVEQRKQTRQPV
jgi:phytoene synthase